MTIQSERCRICEKMVPKQEYKAHFADLHPAFKPYKCKICVTVGYFEAQQLNDHMVTKHAKMITKNANFIPRNSVKPSTEEKLPENENPNEITEEAQDFRMGTKNLPPDMKILINQIIK